MNSQTERSYRYCRDLARRAASSFYWSFGLLPWEQRRAMWALYAFSRCSDDLADSDLPVEQRAAELAAWRGALAEALTGEEFAGPIWPALADTVRRFAIPREYLFAIVDGVAMDLRPPSYETFVELERYCYHVASAVGLACIHIWGLRHDEARRLADRCGVAFQLTNILRDLQDDARRGRVYLPREELVRFGCAADDFAGDICTPAMRALTRFQITRVERLYDESAALASLLAPAPRRAYCVMHATYHAWLDEIRRRDGDVFSRPVELGYGRRCRILLASLLRPSAAIL